MGNRLQVTDYEGGVTKYGYDADGLVTTVWKEDSLGTYQIVGEYGYDTTGKLIWKKDAVGHETIIHRNAAGWVTKVEEVGIAGMATSFQYDLAGNLINKTLPITGGQNSTWSYSYDEMNRLIAVEEPGAVNSATYTYDPNGNLTNYSDPNSQSASFFYNEINKVSEVTQADRETRHFLYDGEGRVEQSWDQAGGLFTQENIVYIDGGITSTNGNLKVGFRPVKNYYNIGARQIILAGQQDVTFDRIKVFIYSVKNPSGNWTVSLQTGLNGVPSGTLIQRNDGSDAVVTIPAPTSAQEWFEVDIGQGTSIFQDSNFWIVFKQTEQNPDANWNLGRDSTILGHPWAYNTDGIQWIQGGSNVGVELIDMLTIPTAELYNYYTYNPEGSLAMAALADSQDITHLYNKRGQPTQSKRIAKNLTEVETNYTYYTESGQLASKNTSISTGGSLPMSYKYNALGQVMEIDHPGSDIDPVRYNYTADGFHRLESVTDGVTNYVSNIGYDLAGRPTAYTFANGFTETISRDSLGRPDSYAIIDPTASVTRFLETYVWDARGNLESRDWTTKDENNNYIDGDSDSMLYDPNDRLESVVSGTHLTYDYSYDAAGNQLWDPLAGASQTGASFSYDSVNRMTRRTLANGDYFQFDWTESDGRKRGNLVSKTFNDSGGPNIEALYTWTEDNLLLRADTPNVGYSDYLYDAGGDRIHKLASQGVETFYAFNGLGVAYEEEDSLENGTTKRYYIHAMGRHVASVEIDQYSAQENYYFHADYLGSVRMISDENAVVVWQKRYTPFGDTEEESGTIENTYQFTGKGWDEDAGLFYFNARWYDADVGRFISEDPLWGSILDPQSLNRFAYGKNNPYRFTDPTGMEIEGEYEDELGNSDHDEDPSNPSTYNRTSDGGDGGAHNNVRRYNGIGLSFGGGVTSGTQNYGFRLAFHYELRLFSDPTKSQYNPSSYSSGFSLSYQYHFGPNVPDVKGAYGALVEGGYDYLLTTATEFNDVLGPNTNTGAGMGLMKGGDVDISTSLEPDGSDALLSDGQSVIEWSVGTGFSFGAGFHENIPGYTKPLLGY